MGACDGVNDGVTVVGTALEGVAVVGVAAFTRSAATAMAQNRAASASNRALAAAVSRTSSLSRHRALSSRRNLPLRLSLHLALACSRHCFAASLSAVSQQVSHSDGSSGCWPEFAAIPDPMFPTSTLTAVSEGASTETVYRFAAAAESGQQAVLRCTWYYQEYCVMDTSVEYP